MKKTTYSFFKVFIILAVVLLSGYGYAQQEVVDDPNLDQIPQWYLDQIQDQTRQNSQVVTINDFDNFYLGVDFAEGHISVNPLEPTQFFTAFNTDGAHYTNDGHNWVDSNPVWGSAMRGDPVTAYDGDGNLYYENMYGSITGCKVVKSSDNGQTWGPAVNAILGNDKNWIAADHTNGPYANYVYTTMTNSGSGRFVRSTDQGTSWQNTFNPSTQSLPGMMVCVGPDDDTDGGSVYVVTNSGSAFSSNYTFYKSNDGGSTFQNMGTEGFAGYVGRNLNGRNSVENMRTRPYPFITADNSNGPNRGRLHLVYAKNDPPGDGSRPDIFSRYSDDGGDNWSDAKKVNNGFFPSQSHQWQPATWCDNETGRLYVQWMDTRDTPTNDSAMIYATYSDDGGVTYMPSTKISNEKMKINCSSCGGGGTPRYQGDYSGIVSNPDVSMSSWSDFRWGNFASFTTYFPDFAMRVYPEIIETSYSDTLWAVVPDVKLYDNEAIFTATIEDPASGTFSIDYPEGNSLTVFPDSIPIVITIDMVPVGEYVVTVKGEGPNGTPIHFREAIFSVLSAIAPIADFSSSDTTICEKMTINFSDESINGPVSWLWFFEGGTPETSTDQFPTGILYGASGDFDVSLEVTNAAGSNLITKTDFIIVNLVPDAPTGESQLVCENLEIPSLEAVGENINWYSDPDLTELVFTGNIFNTGNTLPGVYPYYATQTLTECESEAMEISLTIYEIPEVTFAALDTVCVNSEIFTLENGLPEGGTYFGDGVVDGSFDPSLSGVGTHNLGYFYADENLCADTAYQDITVEDLTEITIDPTAAVCINDEAFAIEALPEGGEFSGTGIDNNLFYPEVAGAGEHEITYAIIDENGCSNSASQLITVNEMPLVNIGVDTTICGSADILLDATIANPASYLWTPGDYTTASITVDSTGIGYDSQEYSVVVTDANGCSSTDDVIVTFINCTGIDEIVGLENVMVYPNPNDGTFSVNINSSKSITLDLKVYNAIGVKYIEQNQIVINGKYSSTINLQDIKSGLYFITLESDEGVFVKKFLVK